MYKYGRRYFKRTNERIYWNTSINVDDSKEIKEEKGIKKEARQQYTITNALGTQEQMQLHGIGFKPESNASKHVNDAFNYSYVLFFL